MLGVLQYFDLRYHNQFVYDDDDDDDHPHHIFEEVADAVYVNCTVLAEHLTSFASQCSIYEHSVVVCAYTGCEEGCWWRATDQ